MVCHFTPLPGKVSVSLSQRRVYGCFRCILAILGSRRIKSWPLFLLLGHRNSSSASRLMAGDFGFLTFTERAERPDL
jgi:hypothetical protein